VNRSIPALAIAGALALGSALVATPAQAAPNHQTYYSVPFSGDLYVTDQDQGRSDVVQAGYEEWAADGFPKPVPAAIAYRSFSWSPDIYADVSTDAAVMTIGLDFDGWQRAGSPRPSVDVLPAFAGVYRYSYSDEVFLSIYSYGNDYAYSHKLTFAEYGSIGQPAPTVRDEVFQKLSWFPAIVGPSFFAPFTVQALDFSDWDYSARPTPQVVKSFDGDRFCKAAGSADIRYVGIAAPKGAKLTFNQWREAGSPAPARC